MRKLSFEAAFSRDQAGEIAESFERWAPTRRLAYTTLSYDSEALLAVVQRGGDSLAEKFVRLVESIEHYVNSHQAETELLKAAQARIAITLEAFERQSRRARQRSARAALDPAFRRFMIELQHSPAKIGQYDE